MAFDRDDEAREIYMRKMQANLSKLTKWVPLLIVLIILLFLSIKYVPAGHVAVLTKFGQVQDQVLREGTHFTWPWLSKEVLDARTQEMKEKASVPSQEGLLVTLDTSLLYRLNPEDADQIFRTIGPGYAQRVVEPTLRSAIRSVTAANAAQALYTGAREMVAQRIEQELVQDLQPRGIVIERVLLRDVQLPAQLAKSIELKQQAEQDALRMEFVLQKEQQEAERKRIEAQGIRDFQRTVAQGISRQLLTWKGIEATEKLAQSQNAKVVVIGSGETGLPIILGGSD